MRKPRWKSTLKAAVTTAIVTKTSNKRDREDGGGGGPDEPGELSAASFSLVGSLPAGSFVIFDRESLDIVQSTKASRAWRLNAPRAL
jgi:hypothetical protein